LQESISKLPHIKRAGAVAQDVGLEFKPWYLKKKKKKSFIKGRKGRGEIGWRESF
jgi:hypothetical protein